MIERPTSAGGGIAQAGAETSEAADVAPPPASAAPEAERSIHVLAANVPVPALAAPAPPPVVDRPGPRFGSTAPRPSARRASRVAARAEGTTYRVIFACCMEATDTPIK